MTPFRGKEPQNCTTIFKSCSFSNIGKVWLSYVKRSVISVVTMRFCINNLAVVVDRYASVA